MNNLFTNEEIESQYTFYNNNYLSIINTNKSDWQKRKKRYLNLGIESELGRSNVSFFERYKTLGYDNLKNKSGVNNGGFMDNPGNIGASVFDPVLCELIYTMYLDNKNNKIIDPFAGGSVRGIIAHYLGFKYTGIELRPEQVESNIIQSKKILSIQNQPNWIIGDSLNETTKLKNEYFDLLFTCPPYYNLEVYSDLKEDISNMDYNSFLITFETIISNTYKLIKKGGFACVVIQEVRDKNGNLIGLVPDTINAFKKAGFYYYNELILQKVIASKALLSRRFFNISKKITRHHENVLIFRK